MQELAGLKTGLDAARCGLKIWSKIHLDEEVLQEVLDLTDQFTSSSSTVGGLLLKDPAGAGKTLLAVSIAEAARVHFMRHGVNTIKMGGLGQNALAVKELFAEAAVGERNSIFGAMYLGVAPGTRRNHQMQQ